VKDPATVKAELRAQALARRAGLSEEAREAASRQAVAHLRAFLRPREIVSLFWPIRGEIDPRPLARDVRALGGAALLPVVVGEHMVFREWDENVPLEGGAFGTRHPPSSALMRDPDLIVAPLAAFDRRGGRIGYGRGYYDNTIARLKARGLTPRLVGLAFAVQEVEACPMEPHDQAIPAIVTEDGALLAEAAA
jgi:5-formyltetrahydrofolate cyclo-ligase